MRFSILVLIISVSVTIVAAGCASGGGTETNPLAPSGSVTRETATSEIHLWGYYDIEIDAEAGTVEILPARQAMFTCNVVTFLNANPAYLGIGINKVVHGDTWVGIGLDVSIAHPFPGLPKYDGYDVRGVFMGDGSLVMGSNEDLIIAELGTDQYMLADPVDPDIGQPDGYTRWFNAPEFDPTYATMPLFAATPGLLATKEYCPGATLNPYKYFADDLASTEDVFPWLTYSYELNGRFSSGNTATRYYYLRFPESKGIKFGYAILANWAGPDVHPANTPEAVAANVEVEDNLWFVDHDNWGGKLIMDISIFDWFSEIENGVMEDYNLLIESNLLDDPYVLTENEMAPVGGTEQYSTFHVEIYPDIITGPDYQEVFILAEYPESDYQNDFGVPNLAYTDPVTTVFRYWLFIADEPTNFDPVCDLVIDSSTPMPASGWDVGVPVTFDATGSWDEDGDTLSYEWDFDGDGIYGEDPDDSYTGDMDFPTHKYKSDYDGKVYVKVTDGNDGEAICEVDVEVVTWPSKNIPLRDDAGALDFGIQESNGDMYILYDDWEVWVYTLEFWYQAGEKAYDLPADFYPEFMDVAPTGYMGLSYGVKYKVFSPSGSQTVSMYLDGGPVRDVANMGTEGEYANDLAFFIGTNKDVGEPTEYVRQWWHMIRQPLYDYDSFDWCAYNYNESEGHDGFDKTYYEYVKGIETDTDGESIWVAEQPDYYCSRWIRSNNIFLQFSGDYFGDGTQASWVELMDLARDSQGRLVILDFVDDVAVCKVFTGDQFGGELIGEFGDLESIIGVPLRADGSDYDGCVAVLHQPFDSPPYMLSIFLPEEMP